MALRKNNQRDFDKFNDPDTDVLGNKRNLPKMNAGPGDTTRVSDKYKIGDYVDEYEFEDEFKKQHGGFPQLSVQDYSKVRKGKDGENIVVKLKDGEIDD